MGLPTESTIQLDDIYVHSDDMSSRGVDGDLIIIPMVAENGDMDDAVYSLNETGVAIWVRMDGVRSLRQIAGELADDYAAPVAVIERDVIGLVSELVRRKMVVAK